MTIGSSDCINGDIGDMRQFFSSFPITLYSLSNDLKEEKVTWHILLDEVVRSKMKKKKAKNKLV